MRARLRVLAVLAGLPVAAVLAGLPLAGGCVPKGRYELAQVQLDATRTALSARSAQCTTDAGAAEARIVALEREIALRQTQLDELAARADLRDAELARVQQERLVLLDELALLRAEVDQLRLAAAKKRAPPVEPTAPPPAEVLARDEIRDQLEIQSRAALERRRIEAAHGGTREAFEALAASGRVEVVEHGDAVVVRIPTGQLFQQGFTTLSPRGRVLVDEIAAALKRIPGRWVTVEGHTDDRKVHTAEFPSSWERAFSHALTVMRAIEGAEVDARLSVASFAATRPIAPNDTPHGRERNERIELRIALDPELATRFVPELIPVESAPLPPVEGAPEPE